MTIRPDPEGEEVAHLLEMTGLLSGKHVLEVGCGSGRLTRRYAELAGHVVGIDHNPAEIGQANALLADELRDRVEYRVSGVLEFEPESGARYDIALFSWSL